MSYSMDHKSYSCIHLLPNRVFSLFFHQRPLSTMIDLRISADQKRRREQIRRYWKLDASGSDFAESMDTLKEDFELSQGAILGIVRSNSRAVSKIHECDCGHRKEFDSRKDFRSTPKQKPFVCPECHENGAANGAETSGGSSREEESPKEESTEEESTNEESAKEESTEDMLTEESPTADLDEQLPVTDGSLEDGSLEDSSPEDYSPEELRKSLRQLARILSKASQRAERLSHKVNG